jgi:D-alanyl-D-alanine carboxypeptidase (penicillin-binding protein 5/6)
VGRVRLVRRLAASAAAALALAAPAAGAAPEVGGRAYYVQNASSGEVLLARNADDRLPIASITKLMTVLVALEHARLDEVVTVTGYAAATGESTIGLEPGERIRARDLVEAALIQSANDAAVALADHVGGSVPRFVALMNRKARELGLDGTHFANPDGLDAPGHYSTARDVTRLAQIAMHDPTIRDVVRRTDAVIAGGRELHTWNDLLSTFPRLIGVKTGHTNAAGWSEVAAARGRGVTIYATLLGEPTRAQRNSDLAALLAWGLSRYRVVPVISGTRVYARARAPYGRRSLDLVARRELLRVVRVDRTLREEVVAPAVVSLPVARGQRLGEVRVYAGSKLIGREPLVAGRAISRPGAIGRAGFYLKRTGHHLWSWVS